MPAITDPAEPDYCESSFPLDDFPNYDWTHRPAGLPAEAWTTETTHRDGQQGGLPLTTEQSLRIYDLICRFTGSSGAFFSMVKGHTWQGTFGDPYYGGNANFIGWDLIDYPGVRIGVTPADQARLEAGELPKLRRSAYEHDMFEKATVLNGLNGDVTHGD